MVMAEVVLVATALVEHIAAVLTIVAVVVVFVVTRAAKSFVLVARDLVGQVAVVVAIEVVVEHYGRNSSIIPRFGVFIFINIERIASSTLTSSKQ